LVGRPDGFVATGCPDGEGGYGAGVGPTALAGDAGAWSPWNESERVRAMSTTLKWLGFAMTAAFAGFSGLIVVGYTLTDVGGWKAVGLIAAVAVPLVLLCLVAYHRPSVAAPLLGVAACVPIGFGVMQLVDYQRWSDWEDQTGPVSLVLVLLVAVPLAVLGLSRAGTAGRLLLAATVIPLLLAAIGAGPEWWRPLSIGVLLLPLVVSGVLFVLAGRERPSHESVTRPGQLAH
jgi:MFS family permease